MREHRTGLRKLQPIQKAGRLIDEGRVSLLATDQDVYTVEGDTDTYNVVAGPGGIFCPCEARTPLCSHVLAVAQVRGVERASAYGVATRAVA